MNFIMVEFFCRGSKKLKLVAQDRGNGWVKQLIKITGDGARIVGYEEL